MTTIWIIIIFVGSFVFLSLLAYSIIVWFKTLAKRNVHFTQLGNEQGKLIMKEQNIVGVISNMKKVHYDENGELQNQPNPKDYGSFFKEFGIIFFGITPIKEIYKFSISWNEFVEKETKEVKGEQPNYEVIKKNEKLDYFKRFYTHAIQILRVELNDGSKIDLVFLVAFEILNIIQVIFKIKPDGIILAQAETGFAGAVQDELREFSYEVFRNDVDKSNPDSPFVKAVLQKTNAIIESKFHLRAVLMEMKFYDLSKGEPGDEDFEKAQKAKKLAQITGDAKIVAAKKAKTARKIEGEANREYFEEIVKVVGKDNIANFANLEQVKSTQLLSYGQGSTPVTPVVNVTPNKKGEKS